MKRSMIAIILMVCLILSGCAKKQAEKAEAGYSAPDVVKDNGIKTGEKTDVSDEGKKKVQTQTGDTVTVDDYTGKFPVVTESNTFTVFDLNLCVDNGEGARSYGERFKVLKQLLLANNPDILTFQEVGSNWMDYLVTLTDGIYDYRLIYPDQNDKTVANPIFFKKEKFQDVNAGSFWLSATPDEESECWSGGKKFNCNWLELADKGSKNAIYVFNAQLGGTDNDRKQAAAVIKEKCASIGWKKPIVCNLDLGATKESEAYQALIDQFSDANNGKITTVTSHSYTGKGTVSDFSLYTKLTIQANSYQVITDRPTNTYVSDHDPIMTKYSLNTDQLDYNGEFIF